MSELFKLDDYDSEPVVYCSKCLSLNIKHEDIIDSDCCMDCGCTDMEVATIDVWENKWEKKYGHKFAVKSDDPRKSPVFKMSIGKLIAKVSDYPKWESIVKEIYGFIPKGFSKADVIVMFFDKLIKDNKLDSLRMLLYKKKI